MNTGAGESLRFAERHGVPVIILPVVEVRALIEAAREWDDAPGTWTPRIGRLRAALLPWREPVAQPMAIPTEQAPEFQQAVQYELVGVPATWGLGGSSLRDLLIPHVVQSVTTYGAYERPI